MSLSHIATWNILNDQIIEHEKIVGQLLHLLRASYPSKHFRYYRRNFGPFTRRILMVGDFNDLTEWEQWINDMHVRHGALMELWRSCIDQSSHKERFWREITYE
jgi:hypothetical protein